MSDKTLLIRLREIHMLVLDFDGVLTDNRVLVLQDGTEGVFCSRSDGLGIDRIKQIDVPVIVISTEVNPVVSARCKKLKIDCIQGCSDKLAALIEESKKRSVPLANIAYLGNDVNDLECMQAVGFAACVRDAYPQLHSCAHYVTERTGGHGAVRELCDLIIAAHTSARC